MKNLKMWPAFFFFVCAVFSAFLHMKEEIPYILGKTETEKLAKAYVSWADGGEGRHVTDPGIWTAKKTNLRVDFVSLKEINPDIIGWIYITGAKPKEATAIPITLPF